MQSLIFSNLWISDQGESEQGVCVICGPLILFTIKMFFFFKFSFKNSDILWP